MHDSRDCRRDTAVHCAAMLHTADLSAPESSVLSELSAAQAPSITLVSGRQVSKSTLFVALQLGGWMATYFLCTLAAERKSGLWPALVNTLLWAIVGCIVTLGSRYIYRRSRRLHHSYLTFAAIALASSMLLAPLWYFLEEVSIRTTLGALLHFDSLRPIFTEAAAREAREPLLLTRYMFPFYSIILFTWASLYFGINAILELESARANVVTALKLADTARLRALQSNLNPHFLFNALNGIATLVRERDSANAAAMVDALSTFLRSTLLRLDTPELRVAEEIELIEQYLRVQRYRFGTRLHAVVEVERESLDALIPTLILQPLVENAVRYGVLPRESGGTLWVSVRKELDALIVLVEDDGPGLDQGTSIAYGMGLQNSSDRLNALYGGAASLTIGARAAGSGCAVIIRLPFRTASTGQASPRTLEAARA